MAEKIVQTAGRTQLGEFALRISMTMCSLVKCGMRKQST